MHIIKRSVLSIKRKLGKTLLLLGLVFLLSSLIAGAIMIDQAINSTTIMIFYAVGLITTLVSTAVPIIYMLELNPKEILMQGKIG